MHVNKVFETPEGTVKFEGELEQKEADLVIKIGLSILYQSGTLKIFRGDTSDEEAVKLND